jgi:hypothetical protein
MAIGARTLATSVAIHASMWRARPCRDRWAARQPWAAPWRSRWHVPQYRTQFRARCPSSAERASAPLGLAHNCVRLTVRTVARRRLGCGARPRQGAGDRGSPPLNEDDAEERGVGSRGSGLGRYPSRSRRSAYIIAKGANLVADAPYLRGRSRTKRYTAP